MELEQQWDRGTQKGLMGRWAVVGGVPAPITGGTVDGNSCPKTLAFQNPLLGAQTRAHLGLISTCPAGGSVREGGGETWG